MQMCNSTVSRPTGCPDGSPPLALTIEQHEARSGWAAALTRHSLQALSVDAVHAVQEISRLGVVNTNGDVPPERQQTRRMSSRQATAGQEKATGAADASALASSSGSFDSSTDSADRYVSC